jgi:hypothetical protein
MSFKNPIKLANLPKVKGGQFLKVTATILSKKFLDGNSVPFLILTNHIYLGFDQNKSNKLPFFMIGERHSCWKDFHKKKTDSGESQKDYMVTGTCRRNGDEFILSIDGSKGLRKLPRPTMKFLNAMLQKINKKYSVSTTGGSAGVVDEATQGTKANEVKEEMKGADEQVMRDLKTSEAATSYKAEKKAEAQALSKAIKHLSKMMSSSLKSVAKNVKKGATSSKDIQIVKEANQSFTEVMNLFEQTSEQVRKKFKAAHQKLNKQKKELYTLSLAAKQRKKSVAERLAEQYALKKTGQVADESTIKDINEIVKKAFKDYRKVRQDELLRMLSFLFSKVGINQEAVFKYLPQVIQQKAR